MGQGQQDSSVSIDLFRIVLCQKALCKGFQWQNKQACDVHQWGGYFPIFQPLSITFYYHDYQVTQWFAI
jgi:hypothetical protein